MNKSTHALLALCLFTGTYATAQNTKNESKKEIVIEEKSSGKNEKMVIVIDGDKMTINGKPADEYKGNKRIVIDNDLRITDNEIHVPRAARMMINGFDNRALLGVVTEKADNGALVKKVIDKSAADKAGLQEGDVITAVNGQTIKDRDDLVNIIGKLKPGEVASVNFLRDGKEKKASAKLGKPAPPSIAWNYDNNHNFEFKMDPPVAMAGTRSLRRGLSPLELNDDDDMWMFREDRPKYGLSIEDYADGDGVKITDVEEESSAAKAGLKEDDVITGADGKAIKSLDDLKDVLRDTKEKTAISLKVLRGTNTENITLKVPKIIKKAEL